MQIRTSHTRIVYYSIFYLIFCTICLQGAIYLKRYDNFHVARSGVTLYGEAASTNAQNYFRFPLEQFSSPNVTPMWPRNYVYLRRLGWVHVKHQKRICWDWWKSHETQDSSHGSIVRPNYNPRILLQVNDYEIVINFLDISHNLTWYSAIVHKFTRIYPVCSTYELTKQFM